MAAPTYDALKLPDHVKTILVSGAGGFVGQQLVLLLLSLYPSLKVITTDIVEPPSHGITDKNRLVAVKADLGKIKEVEGLFKGEKIDGVFALHGIMSGGAEANFDLGYSVNVDSNLNLLRTTHKHSLSLPSSAPRPLYVFVSSLAIYGGPKCKPTDYVVPKDTPVIPGSSYGVQKSIIELYVYDYGRKGYLNTRSVRLPTVAIRPGAPSSAASSFISGLIREPLQGLEAICPIASSYEDKDLDDMPFWCSRTKTVVRNIAWAMCMPESNFASGESRSINIPGIKVRPRQIIEALIEHGGKDKFNLIKFEKDQAVINICKTWAGEYDNSDFLAMGFEADATETGFALAVQDFKDDLEKAK
ncbi:NAD-dependent epimerase/dehydratase [Cryptococcus wingfieldii CBS 7118]|uniref:NAD-dependent epimerase/dehydratase n=1 Tax=Cryptococcus wingfieldii CBS 7118 TaxID=1295528 RepID=A0A1E3K758_9TREE|nr:NAD-dependent epimerase/dehydratase [Cryptococcus wingfieldii CBS 7118]ODO08901.1 NAD-dependent epimerase/dehydratase [Cryptococcus wingfieldii CBS 7118]